LHVGLRPINREIFLIVNANQGESKGLNNPAYKKNNLTGANEAYNILIVSPQVEIHQALQSTLQHFSLDGKKISIYSAKDLQQARLKAEKISNLILIVIDDIVQVNGSYKIFEEYILSTLGNPDCCITFKEKLLRSNSCKNNNDLNGNAARFHYARERLIDITRMVMMTIEMQNKIVDPTAFGFQELPAIETKDDPPLDKDMTKEGLYTTMAKDLKEPVGNIKVMLDFLTNEPELLDQKIYKDLLVRVRESANNIHEMLEDYLFWSRMFRQEIYFHPSKVDLSELVRENLILLKSTAASKSITLESGIPEKTCVFADEYMINTVIRNLLYNAIKFTSAEEQVYLESRIVEEKVEIRIHHRGIPIPKEDLSRLFETDIYFSTTGIEKGSAAGFGLALCRNFIERNGGSMIHKEHDSEEGTFIFTLPAWTFAEHA
jgi:signal transduction histidine kinase